MKILKEINFYYAVVIKIILAFLNNVQIKQSLIYNFCITAVMKIAFTILTNYAHKQ